MKCIDPETGKLISLYEVDALPPEQKSKFESHLLECDYCFQSLYSLSQVVEQMRENPQAFSDALSVPQKIPFGEKVRAFWDKLVSGISVIPAEVFKPVAIAVPVVAALIAAVLIISGPTTNYSDLARIEPVPYIPLAIRGSMETTEAEKLFDEGMQFYGSGKYSQAIIKLSQAISKMDKNPQAHFYLGLSYLLSNETDSAIVHFREATETDSKSLLERCHWYLGNAYLLKDDEEKALEEFGKVLEFEGDYWFEANEIIENIRKLKKKIK